MEIKKIDQFEEMGDFLKVPKDYMEQLLELVEDAHDIAAYQEAIALDEEAFPIELFDAIDAGESPLKVFRTHRGMTQAALAQSAGLNQSMVNHIENGTRKGTVETMSKLAKALDIDLDTLVDA